VKPCATRTTSQLDVPLILAAAEPLASISRSVSSYLRLAPAGIDGNPETTPDVELAAKARAVLDEFWSTRSRAARGSPAAACSPCAATTCPTAPRWRRS
jgi:hypothetical protein